MASGIWASHVLGGVRHSFAGWLREGIVLLCSHPEHHGRRKVTVKPLECLKEGNEDGEKPFEEQLR